MFMQVVRSGAVRRSLLLAGLIAGSAAFASSATAGECPADQRKANAREAVAHKASGKTDTVVATIDLGKEAVKLKGSQFRARKLVIEPGGVVPWHSHAERPALILITEGEIHEYASNCAAPIVHKAGEVARESHEITGHWWKNLGDKPVTIYSFDILTDKNDKNM